MPYKATIDSLGALHHVGRVARGLLRRLLESSSEEKNRAKYLWLERADRNLIGDGYRGRDAGGGGC